jgi:hypothetical protein
MQTCSYCEKEGVIGELTARIDNMERRQEEMGKLVESVHSMATEMRYVKDDISEVKDSMKTMAEKLDAVNNKPIIFWKQVFFIIFTAVVGVFVGRLF